MTNERTWGDNEHGYGDYQWKLNINDEDVRCIIQKLTDNIFYVIKHIQICKVG